MQQNPAASDIYRTYGVIIAWYESLNGVHRQPSKGLTVHRQPSTMQVKINRQKASRCLKSNYFCDLDGIPAPKEFLNWENQFSC